MSKKRIYVNVNLQTHILAQAQFVLLVVFQNTLIIAQDFVNYAKREKNLKIQLKHVNVLNRLLSKAIQLV